MSDYTPTTEEVRDYIRAADRVTAHMFAAGADSVEAFDRWLAAHDAEVRAGVVAEEPAWPDWTAEQVAAAHAAFWAHPDATGGPEAIRAALNAACAAWVPVKQEGKQQ